MPSRAEKLGRSLGDPFAQLRQNARRRLEQRQVDIARGVELVQTVDGVGARRLAYFRRQLDARCARTDDDDVDMRRAALGRFAVGAHCRGEQPAMEALGVQRRVQRDRVRGDAGDAEIVGRAADAEDQRVVRHDALAAGSAGRRRRRPPCSLSSRRARFKPSTAPWRKRKLMPVRDGQVVDVVRRGIHAAGRDLVQQRLPHVGLGAVDQRDMRPCRDGRACRRARSPAASRRRRRRR